MNITVTNTNEFEFLASVLSASELSDVSMLHKRAALDQLLIRSEIGGYTKERVNGNRDLLKWSKAGSDIAVIITRVGYGLYDVEVHTHNIEVKALNIEEL